MIKNDLSFVLILGLEVTLHDKYFDQCEIINTQADGLAAFVDLAELASIADFVQMTLLQIENSVINLDESVEQISPTWNDLHAFLTVIEWEIRKILDGLILEFIYKPAFGF